MRAFHARIFHEPEALLLTASHAFAQPLGARLVAYLEGLLDDDAAAA